MRHTLVWDARGERNATLFSVAAFSFSYYHRFVELVKRWLERLPFRQV